MKTTRLLYSGFRSGLVSAVLLLVGLAAGAQGVSIGDVLAPPDPSALLDVQSVNRGMLIPRMTATQRLGIAAPANGLIVYQTANFNTAAGILRRGYWYWDAPLGEWIHLGREYNGIINQPATVEESSHTVLAVDVAGSPGVNQIVWVPAFVNPPTVLVGPEYGVAVMPPAITEYCQPDVLNCVNGARALYYAVFETSVIGPASTTPPLMAKERHDNCAGANNVNYKYLPYGGTISGTLASSGAFNNHTIDWNFGAGNDTFGMWFQMATTVPKSFTFWVDLNHDGDFTDPGELLHTYNQIPQSVTARWFFSTNAAGTYPPITIPMGSAAQGLTKMRIMIRNGTPPNNQPCFVGDNNTHIYDLDIEILNTGIFPVYPSDLYQCNVDNITPMSAVISCFDNFGTPTDLRYHYKIISHD
jgi:hypothetical protein